MTPERRAELEALCGKATPGPWRYVPGASLWIGTSAEDTDDRFSGDAVLGTDSEVIMASTDYDLEPKQADGDFIAAARPAVPELLDALEAAEKKLDQWLIIADEWRAAFLETEAREKALRAALETVYWVATGEDQLEDHEALDDTEALGWIARFIDAVLKEPA